MKSKYDNLSKYEAKKFTRTQRNTIIFLGSLVVATAVVVPVVLLTGNNGGSGQGTGNPGDTHIQPNEQVGLNVDPTHPDRLPILNQEIYEKYVDSVMDFSYLTELEKQAENGGPRSKYRSVEDTKKAIKESVVFDPISGNAVVRNNAFNAGDTSPYLLPKGYTLPDNVTSIGTHAYYNVVFDGDFSLPNSVTLIKETAFENCRIPMSFKLPDNQFLAIQDKAFYDLELPYNFEIPKNTVFFPNSFDYIVEYDIKPIKDENDNIVGWDYDYYMNGQPSRPDHTVSDVRPTSGMHPWDSFNHISD